MPYRKGAVHYGTISQHITQPLKLMIVKTNWKHKRVCATKLRKAGETYVQLVEIPIWKTRKEHTEKIGYDKIIIYLVPKVSAML